MKRVLLRFCNEEDGAITVDWVVLTAAIVGLAIAAFTLIEGEANALISAVAQAVGAQNDF